jgi:hypothetical protein
MLDLEGRSQSGWSWLTTSYAEEAEVASISAFEIRVDDALLGLDPAVPAEAHAPAVRRKAIDTEARTRLRRMTISLK